MIFKLGELFCGPGGIAKGAITASINDPEWGIVHEWANDFDDNTCRTYIRNICPDSPESVICKDVHKLKIKKLSPIDALAFGAPCNDFSLVGKQKGIDGEYGPLYSYGIKVLKQHKPLWFMFENVSGIKSANDGEAFEIIQNDMQNAGYRIYPNLYFFEQYGIPQARHRMIIIGIRKDLPFEFVVEEAKAQYIAAKEKYEENDLVSNKLKRVEIVEKLIEYLDDGRADDLKEAVNLWYDEKRKDDEARKAEEHRRKMLELEEERVRAAQAAEDYARMQYEEAINAAEYARNASELARKTNENSQEMLDSLQYMQINQQCGINDFDNMI